MKEQTELKQLVEQGLMIMNEGLEDKIKEEERVKEALKKNPKSRVTAIDKLQKDILKEAKKAKTSIDMDRILKWLNCGKQRDKFTFTDSRKIYWLNDNLGYDVVSNYLDTSRFLPDPNTLSNYPTLNEKDLKYLIKLKENYFVNESLYFDYKHMDQCIKIVGSCTIYYMADRSCLYFVNSITGESGLLVGAKYTKTN